MKSRTGGIIFGVVMLIVAAIVAVLLFGSGTLFARSDGQTQMTESEVPEETVELTNTNESLSAAPADTEAESVTLTLGDENVPTGTATGMTTNYNDLAQLASASLTMEEVVETLELPKTLEEIEPQSWFGQFITRLAEAKRAGQTWVDDFRIAQDATTGQYLVGFRPASLKSESETRVRSSITEGRKPNAVISNAPEYALPAEIGTNHTWAKLYIQCVILTNPLEALQLADYLNDVKFNENDTALGQHLSWLQDYLTYMNLAYKNKDRKNLTGQIYQDWVDAGKAPRGLEVTLDPNCEFVSTESNLLTGRVDQMTVSIGLCEVLDAMDREFVTNVTADWFYELIPLESASLLRATRCNQSETGDWVRFQFQDPKSNRILFVVLFNVGDLRVGHPAVVQSPPSTPSNPSTPSTPSNPNPSPGNNPDPNPSPSPGNNPDPNPGPSDNPNPSPNPDDNPDPNPNPDDNPDPNPNPDDNPEDGKKDESLKPDEQGNAPEGGGHNQEGDGVGPYEAEPTVPKSDSPDVQESQYQPQADQDRTHDSHDSSPENTQGHVGPDDSEIQAPDTSSTTTETHQNDDGSSTTTTTTTTGHTEENGGHTQDVVIETVTQNTDGTTTTTLEQIDNENIANRPVEAEANPDAGTADTNTATTDEDDFLPD